MTIMATLAAALVVAQSSFTSTPIATAPAPDSVRVPGGTPLIVELLDKVGSKHAHTGDHFRIRLAEPLTIAGRVVLPAGVTGEGEVVQAKAATFSGSPGELILAARYLALGDLHIPLRGFRISQSGASGVTFFYTGFSAGLVPNGHNFEVPAGARATAKVAADISITTPETRPTPETPQ